jgi:hypothetical protein
MQPGVRTLNMVVYAPCLQVHGAGVLVLHQLQPPCQMSAAGEQHSTLLEDHSWAAYVWSRRADAGACLPLTHTGGACAG